MIKDRSALAETVHWEGFFAGLDDKPKQSNPYMTKKLAKQWLSGWESGQEQLKTEFAHKGIQTD